ncbi:MATE family efflux transporter [Bacteroides sp. 1_1_30]|nr:MULTISPECIES: MATE family efflux transporter [Bacteroides]KAB6088422.1 MATE family efflux transporter [Bacteroides xylanisolvens]KAA4625501.1 MATE family efflux transporter [Bacteroides ovatus]KAA4636836.1 MATE family efflux transporter [Bacteroides ovatus]KAA4671145.1 MATE family efflux transporter [Bacteroides ovatus]KAA4680482.1 MATE family efflux transporter [Bacteroides ovatus]
MYKNTVAMIGIRGVSMILTLISAPIMLHHVDRADYGVLLTLTSIVGWVGYMDVGLGNGLRNKLPEFLAKGDFHSAKKIVSSCYVTLAIYVALIIVIFLMVSPFVDWLGVLNSPTSDAGEIRGLTNVVFIAFCIQFLFGLINSILFAYQMPAFQSLFTFVGQFVALIALVIQVYVFDVTSVLQIGAVNSIIPPLVLFWGSIGLFRTKLKEIAPSFKLFEFKSVGSILSLGLKFFVLQMITIVLFQANSIIIARVVSPEAVVEYNLAFKYVSLLTMIFTIVITPVWSATTDAYVRKDFEWINKTLSFSRKVCIASIFIGVLMVLASKFVYGMWLGRGSIDINYSTTGLILLYISFEMLYKVYGTIINGTGKVFAQIILTGIIAIIYIPLAIFLGNLCGLSGVLIANTIVFALNYVWSKLQCNKLINQTATGIWNK